MKRKRSSKTELTQELTERILSKMTGDDDNGENKESLRYQNLTPRRLRPVIRSLVRDEIRRIKVEKPNDPKYHINKPNSGRKKGKRRTKSDRRNRNTRKNIQHRNHSAPKKPKRLFNQYGGRNRRRKEDQRAFQHREKIRQFSKESTLCMRVSGVLEEEKKKEEEESGQEEEEGEYEGEESGEYEEEYEEEGEDQDNGMYYNVSSRSVHEIEEEGENDVEEEEEEEESTTFVTDSRLTLDIPRIPLKKKKRARERRSPKKPPNEPSFQINGMDESPKSDHESEGEDDYMKKLKDKREKEKLETKKAIAKENDKGDINEYSDDEEETPRRRKNKKKLQVSNELVQLIRSASSRSNLEEKEEKIEAKIQPKKKKEKPKPEKKKIVKIDELKPEEPEEEEEELLSPYNPTETSSHFQFEIGDDDEESNDEELLGDFEEEEEEEEEEGEEEDFSDDINFTHPDLRQEF